MRRRFLFLPLFLAHQALSTETKISMPELAEKQAAAIIRKKYDPNKYEILRNVTYSKRKGKQPGHLLGEIDILVLKDKEIVEVVEVKFSNSNAGKARRKATDQLRRFVINCILRRAIFVKDDKKIDVRIPEVNMPKIGFMFFQGKADDLRSEYSEFEVR